MAKGKKVEDPMAAMATIGHRRMELPEDAEIEGLVPEQPAATPLEPEKVALTPETPAPAETPIEPAPTDSSEAKMSWEDRAKLWQSNYEKLRSGTVPKEDAERMRQENEMLRQMFLRAQQPAQVPAQAPTQVPELKQPRLEDYIDDEYEPADAFDVRTKSGKAYQKYLEDKDTWLVSTAEERAAQRVMKQTEDDKRRTLTEKRASKLCEKYPQYKDIITGEPDYERIQRELFRPINADDDWVMYADFQEYKKTGNLPKPDSGSPDVTAQIEKVANMPSSVAAASGEQRRPEQEVPKGIRNLATLWDVMELPPDAEIDVD